MRQQVNRARTALAAFFATLAVPLAALAQPFEKVEGKVVEDIPAIPFVALAYGFIWIAVLGYLIYVARSLGRVSEEVAQLRRKLDGPAGKAPGGRPGTGG